MDAHRHLQQNPPEIVQRVESYTVEDAVVRLKEMDVLNEDSFNSTKRKDREEIEEMEERVLALSNDLELRKKKFEEYYGQFMMKLNFKVCNYQTNLSSSSSF